MLVVFFFMKLVFDFNDYIQLFRSFDAKNEFYHLAPKDWIWIKTKYYSVKGCPEEELKVIQEILRSSNYPLGTIMTPLKRQGMLRHPLKTLTLFYMGGGSKQSPLVDYCALILRGCPKLSDFSWLCSFQYLKGPG